MVIAIVSTFKDTIMNAGPASSLLCLRYGFGFGQAAAAASIIAA